MHITKIEGLKIVFSLRYFGLYSQFNLAFSPYPASSSSGYTISIDIHKPENASTLHIVDILSLCHLHHFLLRNIVVPECRLVASTNNDNKAAADHSCVEKEQRVQCSGLSLKI
jgi:hypothetical protein